MSDYRVNPVSGVNRGMNDLRKRYKETPKKTERKDEKKDKNQQSFRDVFIKTMESKKRDDESR